MAPPELFPFPFSKALLVAKQQGGLLLREWGRKEGRGGGRREEKKGLGRSGHSGWTFPAGQPPTHTPTGLRVRGMGSIQNHRDWKAEKRKGDCEGQEALKRTE